MSREDRERGTIRTFAEVDVELANTQIELAKLLGAVSQKCHEAAALHQEYGRREMWDEIVAYCADLGIHGMTEENVATWRRRRLSR